MANNVFQFKRTSTTTLGPNTTNSANNAYIPAGSFAINLTDKKVFSSDGSNSFEVGSNVATQTITTQSLYGLTAANVVINSTAMAVSVNSTASAIVNSTAYATTNGTAYSNVTVAGFSTSAGTLNIGNTTANSIVNTTSHSVTNSTAYTNVGLVSITTSAGQIFIGNTAANTIANTTVIQTGNATNYAAAYAANTTVLVGNSTVFMSINATNISCNTTGAQRISTAALGSGTANSTTILYGNGVWAAIGGSGATLIANTTDSQTFYLPMSNTTTGSWSNAVVDTTHLYFVPSTGTLSATIFNSLSDKTLKTDISIIPNALDVISQIEGVDFTWKETGNKSSGVIAQQLETIIPHLVTENKNGTKSVNYDGLIGYLIEAVKILTEEIADIKANR